MNIRERFVQLHKERMEKAMREGCDMCRHWERSGEETFGICQEPRTVEEYSPGNYWSVENQGCARWATK